MASTSGQPAEEIASASGHEYYASPHGAPTQVKGDDAVISAQETSSHMTSEPPARGDETLAETRAKKSRGWFAYMKTRDFYIVLVLGQVLSLLLTTTNTMSQFLNLEGTSIPAFQSLFNYVLLFLVYVPYTVYRYGAREYLQFWKKFWWKYLLLSFCDVEGNYFTVLAYRYTTILSATLINFWAIVMVLIVSFFFLKVRYHFMQIGGILICIGGLGILLASDHITGATSSLASDPVKGDLFALLGATFYGLSNVSEEFLLSERPLYEVLGMMGTYGVIINGVQAGIFDRESFQQAVWNPQVGGYLAGYTFALALFYSIASIVFRMGSAVFFNISLLTTNFWSAAVGVGVFGYTIYYLYPIAFVCIIIGQIIYFLGKQTWGDAFKPWLGENQERGIIGIGTAKRRAEVPDAAV